MRTDRKQGLVVATVLLFAAAGISGCGGGTALGDQNRNNNNGGYFQFGFMPAGESERQVDVLFVVDNSATMANEQATLQGQFSVLIEAFEAMMGDLPSLHVGVVSTDLGTGTYTTIRLCEEVGGDRGILGKEGGTNLGQTCIGPGQRYIADLEPAQCNIQKDPNGQCLGDDCTVSNCELVQQGTEVLDLVADANGCPRCRNYGGELADTFGCLASLGTEGCGFEQHLEAMYRAVDRFTTPENGGFLRDDAYLVVVIVTDEDDCSASDPDTIFNPDPALNDINSSVGFLHSFRCFEFGISCDQSGREPGPRTNCAPREDAQSLLHPVSRYTAALEALKDPEKLVVASIAGPFERDVTVRLDSQNRPEVEPTCTDTAAEGAVPGVRLKAFTGHFNDETAMNDWAYTSICRTEYTSALQGIAVRLGSLLPQPDDCFPVMPAGCVQGPAGSLCSPCFPQCTLFQREGRGTEQEKVLEVKWCGSLCTSGLCTEADLQPCTYDANGRCTCQAPLYPAVVGPFLGCAPLYYPESIPDVGIDPSLSDILPRVEPLCTGTECEPGSEGRAAACFYLAPAGNCASEVRIGIVWAAPPAPRSWMEGRCVEPISSESSCSDGLDNDEDCLTDADDPDCSR